VGTRQGHLENKILSERISGKFYILANAAKYKVSFVCRDLKNKNKKLGDARNDIFRAYTEVVSTKRYLSI
jgi:hypothetical protein